MTTAEQEGAGQSHLATEIEDMRDFLELQSDEVIKGCKIVTAKDIGQDHFLRIDKSKIERFVPNMPKTAMPSENSTTSRVTVAPTLLGCMIGYFRYERDIVDSGLKATKDSFLGGYHISRIDFTVAAKPDATLVSDTDTSDEHWLLSYDEDHRYYEGTCIGKVFISELTLLPRTGTSPAERFVIYYEIDQPMFIMPGVLVQPGKYRATVVWPSTRDRSVQYAGALTENVAVTDEEFKTSKQLCADLLSHHQSAPAFLNW